MNEVILGHDGRHGCPPVTVLNVSVDLEPLKTDQFIILRHHRFQSFTSAIKRLYNAVIAVVMIHQLPMNTHDSCNRILAEGLNTFSSNLAVKNFNLTVKSISVKILAEDGLNFFFSERDLFFFRCQKIFHHLRDGTEANTILTIFKHIENTKILNRLIVGLKELQIGFGNHWGSVVNKRSLAWGGSGVNPLTHKRY